MSDNQWPLTELWVDQRATEYKPYKLDDLLPLNAIPQHFGAAEAKASGHWLSVPRKWKRKVRRDELRWKNIHATQPSEVYKRKSKGWRKHLRKNKP